MKLPKQKMGFLILIISMSSKQAGLSFLYYHYACVVVQKLQHYPKVNRKTTEATCLTVIKIRDIHSTCVRLTLVGIVFQPHEHM